MEGQPEHGALLFTAKKPPLVLIDNEENNTNIKLYNHHVFIMDNCEQLFLKFLNFRKGIVDSRSLLPNIAPEMLQLKKILKVIHEDIAKRCVELTGDIAAGVDGVEELIGEVAADVDGVKEDEYMGGISSVGVDGIREYEGYALQYKTVPATRDELPGNCVFVKRSRRNS